MTTSHRNDRPPPLPASLSPQALAETLSASSNAALLDRAAQADDPLLHELALRYEAALTFLHRKDLRFSTRRA